ncbi:MAG: glycosyltransferase [Anaerolineales bacterium]|nr:glycosyltransferase [Anaerolineales bacterium]
MIQNIRVGIPIIGDQNWIGGITYIELLTKAISILPKNDRPKIFLIVREGFLEALELHQSIFACMDGIIYWGQDIKKAESVIPSPFIHCKSLQRLKEEIDFFYPVTADVFPEMCSASWIPDFQHIYLPEFFSEEEHQKRDESYKKIAEESRLVVLSSKDAENEFKKLFPDTKAIIRVLRFSASIAPELYKMNPGDIQNKYHLPDEFLICCNQFWAHKNHGILFQAIAKLSSQGINIPLVCTGSINDYRSKDYFSQLEQQIEQLGIQNLVHITGFIPREDQIQLMRRSMAIVHPSLFEGWSTVTEDARALGKTIFLSDLRVHYEQAPDHALYFNRYDADSLINALMGYLPNLKPGPDLIKESQAKKATQKRIAEFAKRFCSIAFESQFIFEQKIRGMDDDLWELLIERIPDQEMQNLFEGAMDKNIALQQTATIDIDNQPSPDEALDDYFDVRKQIGHILHLDGPLPIEALNHAVQLLSSVFSDPDAFFSSQENLDQLTPAFFALLQINIETAVADGDYILAENLRNLEKLLSVTTGIELPKMQKDSVPVVSTPSDGDSGKTNPSLIFFHIPKAGGTSLDAILERQFDPSQVYTMDRINVQEAANEFKELPFEERKKYRLLKGHMWFGLKLHEYMPQPCKYVTMLREPIDRVISHYYYAKRTSNHYLYEKIAAENITLKDYVTRQLTLEVNNGQTRLLAELNHPVPYGEAPQELLESAKQNLSDYFVMMGLMERFDESLLIMKRLFGWDDVFYERKNVSKERSAINELPADVLDVIVAHNQLDIELYKHVQALLDEMIAQQGESFFQELQEFQTNNQQNNQNNGDV